MARIRKLIARLADVERPDVGYSTTFGGSAFLPLPGHVRLGSLTWTDHGLRASKPLRELVGIGPAALPFLLDALGDKTPTKLTFTHGDKSELIRDGKMWFSDELPGNPLAPREAAVIDRPGGVRKETAHVETYRVKIGDLCLVAVGQIVGRPYQLARYQMTSCAVVNSPVEDPAFRERVRKIWASDDPARTVFDSLRIDYRTTGPDHLWSVGSRFQCDAALRLLFYFPGESAAFIATRLGKLDVAKAAAGSAACDRRGVANGGVWADEFVHATAWCKESAVREAVRGVFRRTTDTKVFAAAAGAFDDTEAGMVVAKADELLDGLTADERTDRAQYHLLEITASRAGAASAPTFRRLIAKAGPAELGSLAGALEQAKGDWPVALLKPLLDDTRPTDRFYSAPDGRPKVPVRVCDAAAEVLAAVLPGGRNTFPAATDQPTLDRYIGRLKAALAAK